MFIILLKFSRNKSQAGNFMAGHNQWVQQGFEDGVFLIVGNLQPALGGAIVAQASTIEEIQNRVALDPFVKEEVVSADIIEITPNQTDERLKFLLENG